MIKLDELLNDAQFMGALKQIEVDVAAAQIAFLNQSKRVRVVVSCWISNSNRAASGDVGQRASPNGPVIWHGSTPAPDADCNSTPMQFKTQAFAIYPGNYLILADHALVPADLITYGYSYGDVSDE